MNKGLAEILEKRLGISQEQVVREEHEMVILKTLFESELGKLFVFRGGTALRLAYGSPRFSEDLDFSVTENIDQKKLKPLLEKVANELYYPSYLSFESALSRYGVLSQIPYVLTFATPRTTKRIILAGKEIEYRQLKDAYFSATTLKTEFMLPNQKKQFLTNFI